MTLDAATARLVDSMRAAGLPPTHTLDPVTARAMVRTYPPGPPMKRTSELILHSSDGAAFAARLHLPTDDPKGVIVYFHGGGWVIGSMEQADPLGRMLAEQSGWAVLLVDYRLAPEAPFPAALDDAWASVTWLAEHADDLGLASLPVVVAGDSAGGNLAAVVALRARDRGQPQIAAQVLVYPVTDYDPRTASYLDPENQLLLTRESMEWFWGHYLAEPARRLDPEVSPLRAKLHGVAPAIVLTAEHDVLRDEGESYAAALQSAGVPVRHRRLAGQMHGFFSMVGLLPGQEAGVRHVVTELEGLLHV
jgi:acetyl esterase